MPRKFISIKRFNKLLDACDKETEHWIKLYESSEKCRADLENQVRTYMRYKEFSDEIHSLPSCLECSEYINCKYRISLGRMSHPRYNCPLHPDNLKGGNNND